jgi:hypothetical protein
MRLRTLLSALTLAAAIAACGDDDPRLDPTIENRVDTVTLGAIRSTSVTTPSAYNISSTQALRIDMLEFPSDVDFAYDIDPVQGPAFYPAEMVGLRAPSPTNPGMMPMDVSFDSIVIAKSNGYIRDQILPIDSGDVFLARSLVRCSSLGVPEYAKLEVLQVDSVAHTVTFRILANNNCGYRGLEPGLPSD